MKFLGIAATVMAAGLCVASTNAAPEYVLKIENGARVLYHVQVNDPSGLYDHVLHPGTAATMTVRSQTPRVTVIGAGCHASATPSIKTYVTLIIKEDCKIETKAAGISGF